MPSRTMLESFATLDDAMGHATAIAPPPAISHAVVLAAGQAKAVPVPAGMRAVLFSATAPFWARIGGAAAVPAADVLDGTAAELNPAARRLDGAAVVGVAAATVCTVNLAFHR